MNKGDRFYEWMVEIEGKSTTTARKYTQAVNTILKDLYKYKNQKINISDINTPKEAESLKENFLNTEELVKKNKKGHSMYSAGLNSFIKFIESLDQNINLESNKNLKTNLCFTWNISCKEPILNVSKRKKVIKKIIENKIQWSRNPIIVNCVLNYNSYICEIDKDHKYFVSKTTKKNYVEGHHLIPMEFQGDFEYSLDTEANIICLCPICHLILHHGLFKEKENIIKRLYKKHNKDLIKSGIEISLEELLDIYK